MARYFLSVTIPEAEAQKIKMLREHFGVSLLPPHITIVSREEVPEEKINEAVQLISSNRPFSVGWGDVSLWQHEEDYVVIEISRGRGSLIGMNESLSKLLSVSSRYEYSPHVTIGRFHPAGCALRFKKVTKYGLLGVLKPFTVSEVQLFSNQNGRWALERSIPLIGPAALPVRAHS